MAIETELKIPVEYLDELRQRLEATGCELIHESLRENNLLFDTDDRRLASSGRVLRVRTIGREARLTLKGPARYEGAVKRRHELEVAVGDADELSSILEQLGFSAVIRYEKDRETWRHGAVTITLDHTPLGEFVEIEGPEAELEGVASTIGLDPAVAVRGSYLSLWQEYRRRHPELQLPSDMVFAE
jgi:adenylate cyclase class 2